jgi:HAD superfamily hydrolase (TIGR01662 family)
VREGLRFPVALFDRDGTLVDNVPYNGTAEMVRPVPGARAALDRLRRAGVRLGVVSNQSGVARGLLTAEQVQRVNERVERLLGPFDVWQICPHEERDRCGCRKPAPGMVLAAARALDVSPRDCVLIGDIGADVRAALAAGAAGILVPTPATRLDEVDAAPIVVPDLGAAVDWILATPMEAPSRDRVLVARSDSAGDVLLAGPAIRAVAERAAHVTLLCGPRGRAAAKLLPGVDEIVEWRLPWIDPAPPPVSRAEVQAFVERFTAAGFDEAVVFTSFHQSALPLALVLRMAGVGRIAAISDDYPGALLDVRHRCDPDLPEAERALSLAAAAGFPKPAWDDGRLRIKPVQPNVTHLVPGEPFVVVHPGASVPARACPADRMSQIVAALAVAGFQVLVTGSPSERALTAQVAGDLADDLGGRTDLNELAAVLAHADALVVANTGPAHLAAAVGTPVVSLFAPTVPWQRWRPYGVACARLGDQRAPCRDSRATICPVHGHPCLSTVDPVAVVAAVAALVRPAEVTVG